MEIKEAVSDDGNIRPYGSGTAGDVLRDIKGSLSCTPFGVIRAASGVSGVFSASNASQGLEGESVASGGNFTFDVSRVVRTGKEGSPRTSTVNYWRRVPDPI